ETIGPCRNGGSAPSVRRRRVTAMESVEWSLEQTILQAYPPRNGVRRLDSQAPTASYYPPPHPAMTRRRAVRGRRSANGGPHCGPPFNSYFWQLRALVGGVRDAFPARAPHIDACEQEQPDDVDEMPIPGGEFEAEMLRGSEMAEIGANQAHDQEGGADDH